MKERNSTELPSPKSVPVLKLSLFWDTKKKARKEGARGPKRREREKQKGERKKEVGLQEGIRKRGNNATSRTLI